MILHSEEYQRLIAKGLTPGRFVSTDAGEFLSGLPKGWTCPSLGSVRQSDVLQQFPSKAFGGVCFMYWFVFFHVVASFRIFNARKWATEGH